MNKTESAGDAEGPGSAGNADRTGRNPRKAATSRSDASAPSHHHLRNNSHTLQLLSGANRMRWLIAARGIICGLIAGVLVVGYRVGIEYGTRFAVSAYAWLKGHPLGLLGWIAAVLSASWIITRLVQWGHCSGGFPSAGDASSSSDMRAACSAVYSACHLAAKAHPSRSAQRHPRQQAEG